MGGRELMTLIEQLIDNFQKLTDEKQQQVIDFIESLGNEQQKELENMMDDIIDENKEAFWELAK